VNVVSDRWHSRKWPAIFGLVLHACAVGLFIYGPSNGPGASAVVMFAVGLLAGTHMLGFTIASLGLRERPRDHADPGTESSATPHPQSVAR
jgi:hypothetical protein